MDFLQRKLLGEFNLVSNTRTVQDWNKVIWDRNNRNKVTKHVSASCESMNSQSGEILDKFTRIQSQV